MKSKEEIHRIDIKFRNLAYSSRKGHKNDEEIEILKGICGEFKSGRLTAIIGPSGAGKTTLLNILSGIRTAGVTGQITINQEPINRTVFRKNTAFITQESALLAHLTTLETLRFAAKLKLPTSTPKAERREIIDDIIRLLGLEKFAQNYVHHLSGGEKKRLAIAVELITNPAVMFFDEPTSGLDCVSAEQIVTYLKELAGFGHTVVCVVHQPSSRLFQLFDDIFMLSNGNCIFNGPLNTMLDTFKVAGYECPAYYNHADFALEIATMEREGNIEELIRNNHEAIESSVESSQKVSTVHYKMSKQKNYPISTWNQAMILTHCNMICNVRNPHFAQTRMASHIVFAFLLGAVYYNVGNDATKAITNVSCIFFFLLFVFFSNMMPTVLTFPTDVMIFQNQCVLNRWYSLKAYYISKCIADLPVQVLCPLVFILIGYFLSAQPWEATRILQFLLICILMTIISHFMGMIFGALLGVLNGVFLAPAITFPLLVFSGFFIKYNEMPAVIEFMTYFIFFRHGVEGSIRAIYGNNRADLHCDKLYCHYKRVDKFLHDLDMVDDMYWFDIFGLVVWIVVLQMVLYGILKWKTSKEQ